MNFSENKSLTHQSIMFKKWAHLIGCDFSYVHNIKHMGDSVYKLCSSDQNVEEFSHIIDNSETRIIFENPNLLALCLLCAASKNQEKMIKHLLAFSAQHNIELSIEHVSPAFNCANDLNYPHIIEMIDQHTHILSKVLDYTKDRKKIQAFIDYSIQRVIKKESFFTVLDDEYGYYCQYFVPPVNPLHDLLIYYSYDPLYHSCINRSEQSIHRLLDLGGHLALDVLDFIFISSCDRSITQSIGALMAHPKSRALINSSENIALYLSTQPINDTRNDVKNQALILLENLNIREKVIDQSDKKSHPTCLKNKQKI